MPLGFIKILPPDCHLSPGNFGFEEINQTWQNLNFCNLNVALNGLLCYYLRSKHAKAVLKGCKTPFTQ